MTPDPTVPGGGPERVVVSGGSSFLGRRLIQRLSNAGSEIGVVTRTPFRADEHIDVGSVALSLESGDERLIDRLTDFRPDAVVHMAAAGGLAAGIDDVPSLLDASVVLGARLLEAATRCQADRFVSIGSFSERATEAGRVFPGSLYSATKSALMPYIEYYSARRGVRCVALQPTDIYGEGDWRRRFLDLVVDAARNGTELDATSGEQIVSFVHVDDVCSAITAALGDTANGSETERGAEHENGVEFTVMGPEVGPLRDLVGSALAELSLDVAIEWGRRGYRDNEVMEPSFLPPPPGWSPRISLAEGLQRLIDHAGSAS